MNVRAMQACGREVGRLSTAAALVLVIVTAAANVAWSEPIARYVSPAGDDANPGTMGLPFATIQHAVNASADGDSVMLADGEYSGPGNRDIDMLGKAIRVASISMEPELCVINCADPDSTPHIGFIFSGFYNDRPELAGLTVTGATALVWNEGAILLPDDSSVIEKSGAPVGAADQERAVKAAGAAPILRRMHVVGNTGNGFYVGNWRTVFTAYECEFSDNTGNGGATHNWSFRGAFFDCRFERNGASGLSYSSQIWGPPRIEMSRCRFNQNGSHGFETGIPDYQVIDFTDCEFIANGLNGVNSACFAHFRNSVFADNTGWGLYQVVTNNDPGTITVDGCEMVGNQQGGMHTRAQGGFMGGANIDATLVANNGGPGIVGVMNRYAHAITNCQIVNNSGPAVVVRFSVDTNYPSPVYGRFSIDGTTIVANGGPGLVVHIPDEPAAAVRTCSLEIAASIICQQDTSASFVGLVPDTLTVACTDIFGNTTGDWAGPLAPFANQNGNLSVDPLFCADANPSDPWTLHANSPLAAENNVDCGQIGARGAACASTVVACRSIHVYDPATGAYDPAQLNRVVTVEGVVYVAPGTYSETGGGYLQDESGGINFWRSPVPADVHVGDRLRITGPIWPWAGELHIGTYTYTKLDSLQSPTPVPYALADLLDDFGNTGSHVSATGTISGLTTDAFQLVAGARSIEVRRNAYGLVDFGALTEGSLCTVSGPCFKQEGALYLMPPSQGCITTSRLRYVAVDGDDDNLGSRDLPYRKIQRAVNAVAAGDTVVLFDGVYSGPGNAGTTWRDKSLAIRSESGNRDACILECAGANGLVYREGVLDGQNRVISFTGLTIAHADTAIAVVRGAQLPWQPQIKVTMNVADCSLRDGIYGLCSNGAMMFVDRVSVCGNQNIGVGGYIFCGLVMSNSMIRDNGTGISMFQSLPASHIEISSTEIVGNGVGMYYSQESGNMTMRSCRVDSSTVGDGVRAYTDLDFLTLEDSVFRANARDGVHVEETQIGAVRCDFSSNGRHGLALRSYVPNCRLESVNMSSNGGWGLGYTPWSEAAAPSSQPVPDDSRAVSERPFEIVDSTVCNNAGGGIHAENSYYQFTFDHVLVFENGGPGLVLSSDRRSTCSLDGTTIVGNAGDAILATVGDWSATQSLISGNQGAAFTMAVGSTIAIACCDLFGNQGGDWTGPLAAHAGLNGNLNVDPQFCVPDQGDYHLQEDSPLAAANNAACGNIGFHGANCPAEPWRPFEPRIADIPADQGGELRVSWLPHADDVPSAAVPVTSYELQRFVAEWQTITSLAAAAADTYTTVITTPDVLTAGQPIPWSRYRLVARTATPAVFFVSPVDSAYSIDDLAPPKPAAVLVDGVDFRHIVWPQPGIPDLASACVFRGTESGFTPGTPLECPAEFFTESHLAWYFYRVQFTDTHGNLSEFSDELHGQFPTGVGDLPATKLAVSQNVPNPFNPFTTIRFNLPAPAPVTASVFDLSGRLVRTLLSGAALGAGPHDLTWDGRDDAGRQAPSGGYHFRLEAAGESRTVRMLLLK